MKVDVPEPLLLAEGVCHQLNIITYHPSITGKRSKDGSGRPKPKKTKTSDGAGMSTGAKRDTGTGNMNAGKGTDSKAEKQSRCWQYSRKVRTDSYERQKLD